MKKLLLLLLFVNIAAQAQQKVKWPRHKKAVIVLTYDDALPTQLNVAAPQLEAANLTATFFLTGEIDNQSISRWRALSKKGFELANHTLYHPCLSIDDNPVHSESYTPNSILIEITLMNNLLFAIDSVTTRTYAYPCAETTVGKKDYVDTLRKYAPVKYARIGGDVDAVITDFKHLDRLRVPSYGLDDNTPATKLIDFVKRVKKRGGMGIIMFHGIGGDYIRTSAVAHQRLLNYLKNNKKTVWVATFKQAMDYVIDSAMK